MSFLTLSPSAIIPTGKAAQQGLSSTGDMFGAEKISGIKPTPNAFLSENPLIHKPLLLFYSIINFTDKSKIAILHFSHISFFFFPRSAPNQQQK